MSYGDPVPYLRCIRIPPGLESRIRGTSLRIGLVSVLAAVAFAGMLVVLSSELTFVVYTGGACVLGLLVSGVGLTFGRSCVSTGHVNLTPARRIRNLTVAFTVSTVVFAVITGFGIAMATTATAEPLPLLMVAGMITLVTTSMSVTNVIVGAQLFPPSRKLLAEYGVSEQPVDPPGRWGTHDPEPPR
ncbi:hypothetical protein SAMN04487820_11629 [Actinopolyspora mzabensis]|uniref:Uncharacterized protein n=1 Tax=Actinopolyspora mzabensis TaxID=995066 RepID=A0A1G9FM98_ACTMZ|nr:hypothetical protein [Actinopolyspora mzabensis]SDK89510.1 hypothetical protein SAMN04487820_11629 [Actinopolyspora mzabensis]